MLLRLATLSAVLVSLCSADTLTLRSGSVINGQYLGGDARHIRMAIGDHVDTFDVGSLQFGDAPPPPPPPPGQYQGRDQGFAQQPPPPPAQDRGYVAPPPVPVAGVQIPTGTSITIRMIDKVDS